MTRLFLSQVTLLMVFSVSTIHAHRQEDPAVTLFREYLRIHTDHPNPHPGYGNILMTEIVTSDSEWSKAKFL